LAWSHPSPTKVPRNASGRPLGHMYSCSDHRHECPVWGSGARTTAWLGEALFSRLGVTAAHAAASAGARRETGLPAPVRDDIARARSSLAMKSTTRLGWDTRQQRPVVSETSLEEAHADAAEQVWANVRGLQVAPVADATRRGRWLSVITVAQDLGLPIWADDVVMRRLARSMGIPAFGSLDLVRTFENEAGVAAAVTSFRENRVVDLPIYEPWPVMAHRAQWRVDSPFAIAISRPAAWRNIPGAFTEFQSLMPIRPHDMEPENTATWAHLAATGLAMATVPPARPKVVSALLAWVIFFADPFFTAAREGTGAVDGTELPQEAGRVTELILTAAEDLRDQHYPDARALELVVDILCRGLLPRSNGGDEPHRLCSRRPSKEGNR